MRRRVVIACVVAALVLAAGVVLWPRGHGKSTHVAVAPTTSSTTTTAPPKPAHPFEAADAVGAQVNLYDAPGATEPVGSLPNPTVEHVPLAFLVKAHGPPGWVQVQVPARPNESTAWVHADEISTRGVDNRIVIEREARQLTLYKGTTNEVLFQAAVADGTPKTPTPLGNFYVDIVVKLSKTTGPYGPFQLSVAGFSDVLQSFDGGPGQIAIHGTNHPELIGKFVSNGCIRLTNDDITALQPLVATGTPVQIVA